MARVIPLLLMLATSTAAAQVTNWTGAVSPAWEIAGNWDNGVPTSTVDAVIPSGTPNDPSVASPGAACRNLTLTGAELHLDAGAGLTVNGIGSFNSGSLTGSGGTETLTLTNSASFFAMDMSGGPRIRMTGFNWISDASFQASNLVTFEPSGPGLLNLSATSSMFDDLSVTSISPANVRINGELRFTGDLSIDGAFEPAGLLRCEGVDQLISSPGTSFGLPDLQVNASGTVTLDPAGLGGGDVSVGALTLVTGSMRIGDDLTASGTITVNAGTVLEVDDSSFGRAVNIEATSLTVAFEGTVQGDFTGHPGGVDDNDGSGPGGGQRTQGGCVPGNAGGGGGRGGPGGTAGGGGTGGPAYGSPSIPLAPGSGGAGGGCVGEPGGSGGGALWLAVDGNLVVDGTISADGEGAAASTRTGGGSGGSVWITAASLSGAGVIRSNGGDADTTGDPGGAGGGGRVVVFADTSSFTGTVQALGGGGSVSGSAGQVFNQPGQDSLVTLVNPLDESSISTSPLTLEWSGWTLGGAEQFVIELDDDPFFFELTETGAAPRVLQAVASPYEALPFMLPGDIYWHVYVDASGQVAAGSALRQFNLADFDGDGLSDLFENSNCLDPFTDDLGDDPDADGLTTGGEIALTTDPCDPDSDGDGAIDGDEVFVGSNPLTPTLVLLESQAYTNGGRPTDEGGILGSESFQITFDAIGNAVSTGTLSGSNITLRGGLASPSPGEVDNLRFTTSTTLEWDPSPSAGIYNVYRDLLSNLDGLDFGFCFREDLVSNNTTDSDPVPTGDGYFYLVTVEDLLGIQGVKGFESDGTPRGGTICP